MQRLLRWLLVCAVLLTVALPAWAAPRVDMAVQLANEGRVKQGGRLTLWIDLTNLGGESSGELVVELDDEYPHSQYVVPYTLAAGTKKRIPVSFEPETSGQVAVRLYAGGERIAEKVVTPTWLPPGTPMVGVLSGDELGIPALTQFQSGNGQSGQVVRLDATTLADNAGLLDQFDVIALSRFDSASLSKEQLRALEVWVGRGGTLLLAGGPEWRRTIGPLPASLVPVEITGTRSVSLAPLGEATAKPLAEQGVVSVAQLRGAEATLSADGVPLVATAAVGAGRVIYLAFDPGLNPLASWSGQVPLFNRLLGGVGTNMGNQWFGSMDWQIQQALRRLPEWVMPGLGSMLMLLLGYLIVIGPVNYLILKRFDKREWAWLSLPVLSLLFVGGFYFVGFGRFEPVVSHLITITELSPGTGTGTTTSYLGVYAPGKRSFAVPVTGAGFIQPFQMGGRRVNGRVVMGDRTTVEFPTMSNTTMSGFTMEQDITLTGGIDLVEAQLSGRFLTGKLKNRLDRPIDGLAITVGGSSQLVGRLAPGETSELISLALDEVDPLMMQRWGGLRTPSVGEESTPDGQRRSMVLSYLFAQLPQQSNSGIILSGWIETPFQEANFGNTGKLVQGTNLVYEILPLPVGGQSVEIPAGLIQGFPLDLTKVDRLPDGYMLRPGTATFGIVLPVLDVSKVGAIEVDLLQSFVKASVRNQKSGQWVPLTGQRMLLEPWQDFISSLGVIELQYESDDHMNIPAPTVTVRGVSR